MSEQNQNVDIAKAIADGIAQATKGMQTTIETLAAELSSVKSGESKDSNIVDVDERRSADEATLRTVGGVLIKEMKLENKTKVNEQGFTIVLGQTAHIETVDGKKHKIPYGDGSPESYQNLPLKTFKFVDSVDKTGASKVTEIPEYTGRTVPEKVWEGGIGRLTGRQVRMKVVKEIREYRLKDQDTGEVFDATEKMLSYR
jgi:hypothetical protein